MEKSVNSRKANEQLSDAVDLSDAGKAHSCLTEIHYAKCHLTWNIRNFSYCRQPKDEPLPSCIFSADEPESPKFQLDLYPRGTSKCPGDVVVDIRLGIDRFDWGDVKTLVQYDCFIICDQKSFHRKRGEFLLSLDHLSHYVVLVSRCELFAEKEQLFPDDNLKLACAVRTTIGEETIGGCPTLLLF